MILCAKILIFPFSLTLVFTTLQRKLKKPQVSDRPARIVCLLCIQFCISQSDYKIQENEVFGWESHLLKENSKGKICIEKQQCPSHPLYTLHS